MRRGPPFEALQDRLRVPRWSISVKNDVLETRSFQRDEERVLSWFTVYEPPKEHAAEEAR